jgi:hypothetical protein
MLYTTKKRYGFINVFFLLLVLSIPFYYGQHFVVLFDLEHLYKISEDSVISKYLPDSVYIQATYWIIASLLLLHAGFFSVNKNIPSKQIKELNHNKMRSLRIAGWIGVVISAYPMIRYQISLFTLQMALGYGGRRQLEGDSDYLNQLGMSTIMIYLSGLFLPSLYALLIGYKGQKHKRLIYLLVLLYIVVNLVLGSRFIILKAIVVLVMIQFIWITPPDMKSLRKLALLGAILIILFGIVTKLRGMTADTMSMTDASEGMGISSVLWETGITFTCVSAVFNFCPAKIEYTYGASVLGAFLQCLPEPLRLGFFDNHTLLLSSVFSPLYYNTTLYGFGSSFIAEGYWNFGYLFFLYMFILGIGVAIINKKMVAAKYTSSPYLFLILSSICGDLAFGVRNDLSAIPRMVITNTLVIVFIAFCILLATKSENKRNIQ